MVEIDRTKIIASLPIALPATMRVIGMMLLARDDERGNVGPQAVDNHADRAAPAILKQDAG